MKKLSKILAWFLCIVILVTVSFFEVNVKEVKAAINMGQSAQKDQGAATSTTLAYSGAVTIGSTLAACYRLSNGGSSITFSDSVNGSWTVESGTADANGNINGCAYKANTAAGTPTVSVNWTGTVTFRMTIMEITGAATTSPRDQYTNTAFNSNVTAMSSGAVTTTQNDEIIIGFGLVDGSTTWTLGSGYSKVQFVPDSSSGKQATEYKIQTIAGSQNPDWTVSSNQGVAGVITFKAASSASTKYSRLSFQNTSRLSFPNPQGGIACNYPAEIFCTSLFNDANLKAYYRLEDVTDSKGGFTLTNVNSVVFDAGVFNNAADFGTSNTNKDLKVLNNLGIDGGAISIVGWVKILTEPGTDVNYDLMIQGSGSTSNVYYMIRYMDTSGTKAVRFQRNRYGSGLETHIDNTITLGTSVFHHLALTYDGTTLKGYVDGASVGSGAASGNGTFFGVTGFSLGYTVVDEDRWSSAKIDDVAVFNRALSAGEITTIYGAGPPFSGATGIQYTRFLMPGN